MKNLIRVFYILYFVLYFVLYFALYFALYFVQKIETISDRMLRKIKL